ncbi:MAG: PAS domain-containing protein [Phenylobacterium sp.]
MFHANTERMIDYWTSRAADGRAPSRGDIQPADFRQLIPQVFVLGCGTPGHFPFRLAGGFVSDLHGRDLRAENVLALWTDAGRSRLSQALEEARDAIHPVVATAEVITCEGPSLAVEVMFAPLIAHDAGPDRLFGLYQPLSLVARLRGQPAKALSLVSLRRAGADNDRSAHVRLAALDGLQVA